MIPPAGSFARSIGIRMTIAALLPILCVGALNLWYVTKRENEMVTLRSTHEAQLTEARLEVHLRSSQAVMGQFLRSRRADIRDSGDHVQEAISLHPEIESVLVLDASGTVEAAYVSDEFAASPKDFIGLSFAKDRTYQSSMSQRAAQWSGVSTSFISAAPVTLLVEPILDGALIASVRVSRSPVDSDPMATQLSEATWALLDRTGVVVIDSHGEADIRRDNWRDIPLVQAALEGRTGSAYYTWHDKRYFGTSAIVHPTGWIVLAYTDAQQADAQLRVSALILAAALIAAAGLGLTFAMMQTRRLREPIHELSEYATHFAQGDYSRKPPSARYVELNNLGMTLAATGGAVREREALLAASERELRSMIESLDAVPFEYDLASDLYSYVGPQCESVLGIPAAAFVDREAWLKMVHPDDRNQIRAQTQAYLSAGLDHDVRYRIRDSGGRYRHVHGISSVRFADGVPAKVAGVMLDVTDMENANEMRVLAEAAQAATKAKSSFLASMSHELRTPLNAVIGFSGMLAQELPGKLNDEQMKQVNLIGAAGAHLLSLVNQILDLSKIEAGAMRLDIESIDLDPLIADSVRLVRPSATAKGLTLTLELDDAYTVLRTDRVGLTQILMNLLSNAINYTAEGEIVVATSRSAGTVAVSVSDTGIGIAEADMEHLFLEFERLGRPGREDAEGAGLGLVISMKLAHLMGGEIRVKSELGVGSTFTLVLPTPAEPPFPTHGT